MRPSLMLVVPAILEACGGGYRAGPSSAAPYVPPPFEQEPAVPQSLFPGDAEVLTDSAIRRILAHQIFLPAAARIAVLQLGSQWSYRRWWSHELAQLSTQVSAAFQERLLQSPRVAAVDLLPLLLIPEKRTVPHLREAAARFQADLLVVYQPVCGVFERSRFLRADQYRVACTVEAVLLDTRSGIVPFSSFATGEQVAQKAQDDFDLRETLTRAELEVGRTAVTEIATRISQYLLTVPAGER